jgi:PKD repeat protein
MYMRYDASNLYVGVYAPRWNNNNYGDGWSLFISDMDKVKIDYVDKWIRFTVITNSRFYTGISCAVKDPTMGADEWRYVNGNWDVRVTTGAGGTNFTAEFRIGWDLLAGEGFDYRKLVFNSYGPLGIRLRECDSLTPRGTIQFMPLWYDYAEGLIGQWYRPYRVRLYFAEPGLAGIGQRVFDVKLQGQTVLSGFDIVREAGGQWRGVIKEFKTFVGEELRIDFVPVAGEPLISGIEVVGEYQQPNLPPEWGLSPVTNVVRKALGSGIMDFIITSASDPDGDSLSCTWWKDGVRLTSGVQSGSSFFSKWSYNPTNSNEVGRHKIEVRLSDTGGNTLTNIWDVYVIDTNNPQPEAVAVVSPLSGVVPLSVTFDGSGSWDTNGSIAQYLWDFGDGQSATGAVAVHVYNVPGVYRAELTVVDNGGMVNSTSVIIYAMTASGSPWEAVDSDGDGTPDYYDEDDDNDGIPDWWEIAYGLKRRDSSDAEEDADRDGLSNREEYILGTNPLDEMSGGIRIKGMGGGSSGISVIFDGWSGKLFSVEYKEDLMDTNEWNVLTNILGSGQTVEIFDPSAAQKQRRFYRLKARTP